MLLRVRSLLARGITDGGYVLMVEHVGLAVLPLSSHRQREDNMPEHGDGSVRASLAEALTFHASFDHGPDADFALGDGRLYSALVENGKETGELTLGLGEPALTIAEGTGRFGSALRFTAENSHVVLFKAARNVAYSQSDFGGTASFWMSGDPADIPQRYCDPFQLTDKDYSDACIWVDFTKNDTPPDFRLGCFGNQREWDPSGKRGGSEEFFWRLVKVAEPPFADGQWTHVAITWDGLNTSHPGRARLYFNAEYQGASGRVAEQFSWDVEKANIRLGTGHFVGLFDDLAFFNRPFSANEVRALYELENGVADLRKP